MFINKDNELMRGQENQLVLPEDIYDEVNWGSEQVNHAALIFIYFIYLFIYSFRIRY